MLFTYTQNVSMNETVFLIFISPRIHFPFDPGITPELRSLNHLNHKIFTIQFQSSV